MTLVEACENPPANEEPLRWHLLAMPPRRERWAGLTCNEAFWVGTSSFYFSVPSKSARRIGKR
jgi:hypothetical protein